MENECWNLSDTLLRSSLNNKNEETSLQTFWEHRMLSFLFWSQGSLQRQADISLFQHGKISVKGASFLKQAKSHLALHNKFLLPRFWLKCRSSSLPLMELFCSTLEIQNIRTFSFWGQKSWDSKRKNNSQLLTSSSTNLLYLAFRSPYYLSFSPNSLFPFSILCWFPLFCLIS